MEEYIVSARKYRPANFDTVVGQRALTTTLLNAIKTGKLAHAYLFCGPRGVGKTTCARIFAKTINCLHPHDNGEACNECESCRAFEEGRSMNIHELDAASNNSVDDIRELIDQVRIPPQVGRYKVFIIDEVHMLSASAFNAFLKTLEEPPSYVIFILATTEKHKILPTILSRCQVYDFARMTLQNTVEHLTYVAEKEGYTAEPEALTLIAQKADGGMRDALSIFDQMASFTGGQITYQRTLENLNMLDAEYYFRLIDHALKNEVRDCMLLLNEVINRGFDAGNFIAGLASHLRSLLVSKDSSTLTLLETSENQKQHYAQQAQQCSAKFLYRAIKLCNDCDLGYRQSRNKRLQVELCLIQVAQLTIEEDVPGAGRRPAKILKPLFSQFATRVVATTAPKTQSATVASPSSVAISQQSLTTTQSSTNDSKPSVVASQPTTSSTPSSAPLSAGRVHLNFASIRGTKVENSTHEVATTGHRPATSVASSMSRGLTEDSMRMIWNAYLNSLPQSDMALMQRLRSMLPEFSSANSFSITTNSSFTHEDLLKHKQTIESFYTAQTGTTITMNVVLQKVENTNIMVSKPERYKNMIEKNPMLDKLRQLYGLELT